MCGGICGFVCVCRNNSGSNDQTKVSVDWRALSYCNIGELALTHLKQSTMVKLEPHQIIFDWRKWKKQSSYIKIWLPPKMETKWNTDQALSSVRISEPTC